MGEIMKKTEEWRVNDEAEAKALIEQAKKKELDDGYELVSYQSTHKVKKDDDFYIVKLVKQW